MEQGANLQTGLAANKDMKLGSTFKGQQQNWTGCSVELGTFSIDCCRASAERVQPAPIYCRYISKRRFFGGPSIDSVALAYLESYLICMYL